MFPVIVRRALLVVILASLLAPTGVAAAAERDPERGDPGVTAVFKDRTIRLGKSWEGAQACSVSSASDIRCFASAAEMAAATGSKAGSTPQGREASVSAASDDCNGIPYYWLYLYDYSYYGGRILQFNDVNLWQNLGDYGFDNRTSSWWNDTDCYAYLADGAWGSGALMGMPSVTWQGSMGWWANRASAVYIAG